MFVFCFQTFYLVQYVGLPSVSHLYQNISSVLTPHCSSLCDHLDLNLPNIMIHVVDDGVFCNKGKTTHRFLLLTFSYPNLTQISLLLSSVMEYHSGLSQSKIARPTLEMLDKAACHVRAHWSILSLKAYSCLYLFCIECLVYGLYKYLLDCVCISQYYLPTVLMMECFYSRTR